MNRDVILGVGFFILMGVGGVFLVRLNWRKISVDEQRDEQRSRAWLLARHVETGRARLKEARAETSPERRAGLARQAVEALSAAIAIEAGEAAVWADRAEANLLLGPRDAARRDLAEARRLQPDGNWSNLEKRCSAP